MAKKQKSGLYRTKIKIGVDPDGKDIYKYISGKTKAELEEARQQAFAYYIDNTALNADRLFGEYAVEWYHVRKEPFVSASTQNGYRAMLNKHILPTFGERNLRAISPGDLQRFINGFTGKSGTFIMVAVSTLRAIFAAAVQDNILSKNPADNLRKPSAAALKEKRALTDDERARILHCISTHEHGAYLATLYYTGMRPGEVRGLQWGDFDWQNGLIHVQRDIDYAVQGKSAVAGSLKTAKADRFIPITDELKAVLYPLREASGAFVFAENGAPLSLQRARYIWLELMLSCDLAEALPEGSSRRGLFGKYKPMITPHAMRHNFITMCWEKGIDVLITMKLVGHADYQTTMNIYTHLSEKHLESARVQLNSMFDAQKESCTKVAQTAFRGVLQIRPKP